MWLEGRYKDTIVKINITLTINLIINLRHKMGFSLVIEIDVTTILYPLTGIY